MRPIECCSERLLVASLLLGAILAAHGGALRGSFHYDDHHTITENPAIRTWRPLAYLTSASVSSAEVGAAGYRPVTMATFALNYAWGRLDPVGYLAVNLTLHAALAWLVFAIGRVLLGSSRWAMVAALIFAVHPVNAEAINYVVARSSLLAALGSLVALWAFERRERGAGWPWLAAGLLAFVFALLSKESAISLLPPLVAYGWLVGSHAPSRRRVWDLSAFAGVALAYLLLWRALVGGTGVESHVAAYPLMTFAELVGRSLALWIWPWPLGVVHPLTFVTNGDPLLAGVLAAAGIGLVAIALALRRRAPFVVWTLVWILAGFLPLAILPWITTKGLLQENRLVFSAVGLAWLTAASLRALLGLLPQRVVTHGAAFAAGIALVAAAVALDRSRSATWSDERLIWREVIARDPGNIPAYVDLGRVHRERGELEQAEAVLTRALALAPNYASAYLNLGAVALQRERYDEARRLLRRGLDLAPMSWKAHHLLGEAELKLGRPSEAAAAFERATILNPCDSPAHLQLGVIAQRAGDARRAEALYRRAIGCDPNQAEAFNNLATLYLERRDWSPALEHATEALRRNPDSLEAAYNRAVALSGLSRHAEARAELEAVLRRLPPTERFEPYRRAVAHLLAGGQM